MLLFVIVGSGEGKHFFFFYAKYVTYSGSPEWCEGSLIPYSTRAAITEPVYVGVGADMGNFRTALAKRSDANLWTDL